MFINYIYFISYAIKLINTSTEIDLQCYEDPYDLDSDTDDKKNNSNKNKNKKTKKKKRSEPCDSDKEN
ncbi:hypothetical protein EHP00_1926 [Ecytonucleospora hepatopenaei]|uniref:Uncharacterized protein n=1 Tax=Ecytonucleospora hepatopenaei TaxID=646526 RepID=A0A1W0E4A1_9MICR|nr:hypothetical protein EHP00_1926 [Ecytonucleospora hepatopenaei]